MNLVSLTGVTIAAVIAASQFPVSAVAADLRSLKDGYSPMPVVQHTAAGPCYARADVGYSFSQSPDINWLVNNIDNNTTPATLTYVTDKVTNASMENTWFGEVGGGCGFGGSRGVRFEAMFGYRGDRKIDGVPGEFIVTDPVNPPVVIDDPLHTSLTTYTLMLNVYKDFGNFGGFVPYVGAGIGVAYHELDDVYFTGNPFLVNRIKGNDDVSFAWSVMAGVAYQISERAIVDLGYRYIDMGKIQSQQVDSAGFVNPPVYVDDITAHEIKVGLRYHFGGHTPVVASLK